MNHLEHETQTYVCAHWKTFPSVLALLNADIDALRAKKEISEADYARHLVWMKVCGQTKMSPEGCLSCPQVRIVRTRAHKVPHLESLDGSISTPVVDDTAYQMASRRNHHLQAKGSEDYKKRVQREEKTQ